MLALSLILLPVSSPADDRIPVEMTADRLYGNVNSQLTAEGRVKVVYGDVVITADKGFYDKGAGILRLWGNVEVREPPAHFKCERIIYDLNRKRAVIEKADGWLSPTDRIKADRIERLSEKEWIAYDGIYTPCKNDCPDWSVGAKKFKILLGESFSGKWVTFRVKEIPVLVTPFLSGPIQRERSSGFLFPRFGYRSDDGFTYRQPFYLVLGRSADLTVSYEKRFRDGSAKSAELRYVLGRVNNYGNLFYNQIDRRNEKDWNVKLSHTYRPSDYLYGSLRSEVVSNRTYYKAASGFDVEAQTRLYTKSDLAVSKLWEHAILNANAVYLRYLDGSSDRIYQKLPNLNFYLMDVPLPNTPFTFNFDLESTYFYRKAGGSSYRVNLKPGVRFVRQLGTFKNSAELSYLYTYYQLSGDRKQLYFSDRLAFNSFFPLQSGYSLSLNPELEFSYIESENQDDNPYYDISDRIKGERRISPSLEAYLYGKKGRVARISLSSDYLLGSENAWKDFRFDADLIPADFVSLRETFSYSIESGELKNSNTYLNFSFPFATVWTNYYRQFEEEISYLRWGTSVPLGRYFSFSYSQRYDLLNSKDRERSYSLRVNRGCWNGSLSYRWIKNYDDTIDYQITLTINLLKLGSYGYQLTGRKK